MSDKFTQEELSVLMVKQIYRVQKTMNWLKIGGTFILITVLFDYLAHMGWFEAEFYLKALRMDYTPGVEAFTTTPMSRSFETAALTLRADKGATQTSLTTCTANQGP
ncbi:hypothetical protein ACETIH_03130 [Microvirga arabica]|uniref:Uncharacterized protein n=1 Tax=Microvirga arabica TaxID=1128671 RepID=A0ABV6Y372_9HYPH